MNKNWKFLMASAAVLTLAACGNDEEPKDTTTDAPIVQDEKDASVEEKTPVEGEDAPKETDESTDAVSLTKEQYLEKLNVMEAADKEVTAGTTTSELEEQEVERLQKWEAEVNNIYLMLEKDLSPEEMALFDTEQTKWLEQRDVLAKEASDKLEGGSGASLEYTATQAELTKERAYELVNTYVK